MKTSASQGSRLVLISYTPKAAFAHAQTVLNGLSVAQIFQDSLTAEADPTARALIRCLEDRTPAQLVKQLDPTGAQGLVREIERELTYAVEGSLDKSGLPPRAIERAFHVKHRAKIRLS